MASYKRELLYLALAVLAFALAVLVVRIAALLAIPQINL